MSLTNEDRNALTHTEEEIREDRELTQAVLAHSREVMSDIIARHE